MAVILKWAALQINSLHMMANANGLLREFAEAVHRRESLRVSNQ